MNIDASTSPLLRIPDPSLIRLFERQPQRAWELFLDKYADLIFTFLRRLGYDYDAAMDRFVFVCEKLAEQDFRRLRAVKYLGSSGELTPWLVQVVKNLAVNWTQSKEGRRRLPRSIERLELFDQKVFHAYFRSGLKPSGVREALAAEDNAEVGLLEVFDSLERILEALSPNKLWRLESHRAKVHAGKPHSGVDDRDDSIERSVPDFRESPEESLLRGERQRWIRRALDRLPELERLLLSLRYMEGLAVKDAARRLRISERKAKSATRSACRRLLSLTAA